MATTKKLDPFGGGTAINSGTVQTGGGRIYTAGEPQYRTVTARNVPLVSATEPAKPMVERWGSPEWKAAHGTAGATQLQAAQTPLNQATQSSFGEPGSMTAVSAPTNAVNRNPTADNTPTNLIGDPNEPQTITPYGNGATPTYSDYMGVQYTTSRPGDFTAGDQPVYSTQFDPAGKSQAYYDALNNPFTYTKPENYTSRLQGTWDAQLAAAQAAANRQFTYDASTDPVYQAYLKQYAREGQRASANTLGQAAAMTGGRPSSYAVSAASQAGNYYAAQAADKLPELYQQAYQRYLQDYQNKLGLLSAINQRENTEQGIWEGNTNNTWKGIGTDYDIYNNNLQNLYNAAGLERTLQQDEHNRFLNELNQYNTNRNFNYGQSLDDINWEEGNEGKTYERAWNEEDRDYTRSWNEENRDYSRQQDEFNRALQLAELGDYSALEALGYDTAYIRAINEAKLTDLNNQAAARLLRSSGSSSSGGSKTSGSVSGDGGEPVLEDETLTEEGLDEEIESRIDSIINAAQRNGNAVTDRGDWEFLRQYLGDDWLASNGYKFGEGEAVTDLSAERQRTIEYYRRLYPDGIVTNATDWATIAGIYGNAGNAQKTGGFSFVGNYNSSAQTDKGTTTYNENNVSTYDLANPPKEEIVGPMPGYGNNKLMPYQEIGTAARTGSMPVTSKTGGIRTGSVAGSKSGGAATPTRTVGTVTHGGTSGGFSEDLAVKDYDVAMERMQDAKLPATAIEGLLTEEEWTKRKKGNAATRKVGNKTIMNDGGNTGDMSYSTYADYVNAYYNWAINTYKK